MKQLLKFSASWCGPCKTLTEIMKGVDFKDVELKQIDIDDNLTEARKYNIRGVPTVVLLENDVEIGRKIGVMSESEIEEFIHG